MNSVLRCGLRYSDKAITAGAQTKRRGMASRRALALRLQLVRSLTRPLLGLGLAEDTHRPNFLKPFKGTGTCSGTRRSNPGSSTRSRYIGTVRSRKNTACGQRVPHPGRQSSMQARPLGARHSDRNGSGTAAAKRSLPLARQLEQSSQTC